VVRLLAKMPTLAALSYRHLVGQPYVYPEDDLSYAGNLLSMMFRMSELRYQPDPRMERALDVLLMLHADHEQNASTTAVRAVGSTHVNPYSAVAAGVAALSGPMRGAADEAVLKMLKRIGTVANVPDFLSSVKAGHERLMGFGHWVYKTYDPRARILRDQLDGLYEIRGKSPLAVIAHELERRALNDEFFTSRLVYPNVDLYSGLTYEAIGVPPAMFPVMFALARTAGWIAQWLEMVKDPEQRTVRPRQIYTGELDLGYLPIAERD
jgi:citrate synthase